MCNYGGFRQIYEDEARLSPSIGSWATPYAMKFGECCGVVLVPSSEFHVVGLKESYLVFQRIWSSVNQTRMSKERKEGMKTYDFDVATGVNYNVFSP